MERGFFRSFFFFFFCTVSPVGPMAEIYKRQLTARGAGPSLRTARGSNHFLSGVGGGSSPLGAVASRMLSSRRSGHGGSSPQLHTSRSSSRSRRRSPAKRWAVAAAPEGDAKRTLSRSSSLRATVSGALFDDSGSRVGGAIVSQPSKTLSPMLPSGFRGPAKLPRNMLPQPSARSQHTSTNKTGERWSLRTNDADTRQTPEPRNCQLDQEGTAGTVEATGTL